MRPPLLRLRRLYIFKREQYQRLAFALVMSFFTVNLVTLCMLCLRHPPLTVWWSSWQQSMTLIWPLVFICIVWIAPKLQLAVSCMVDKWLDQHNHSGPQ